MDTHLQVFLLNSWIVSLESRLTILFMLVWSTACLPSTPLKHSVSDAYKKDNDNNLSISNRQNIAWFPHWNIYSSIAIHATSWNILESIQEEILISKYIFH